MAKQIGEYQAKTCPIQTIQEHCFDTLKRLETLIQLGYITDEHIQYLLREALFHHDDGKANQEFQRRIVGHGSFDPSKEIPHNILSVYYLDPDAYIREDYIKIASAILFHHHRSNIGEVMSKQTTLIQSLLLPDFSYHVKRSVLRELIGEHDTNPDRLYLRGIVQRCDWSASAGDEIEYPNDFLESSLQQWQTKNQIVWNDMQKFCMEHQNESLMITAQTGLGKTEAGLSWIGNHKGFFVLPVRSGLNAVYDRTRENILLDENIEQRIGLLHSDAMAYCDLHTDVEDVFEYQYRAKALSLPLLFTTLDQIFDFPLRYHTFEQKLATLAYSKVVIDEIQMYTPDLLAYLVVGLKQVHDVGGKAMIMTATMYPFVKDILKKDAGFDFTEKMFYTDVQRHSVNVQKGNLTTDDVLHVYDANEQAGNSNKILVVCNTIKKAQDFYYQLQAERPDISVKVLHSCFTAQDRKRLESEIMQFGQTYDSDSKIDNQSGIWMVTSVVEASLDIDFDYLFIELTELSSLFQRMGRVNRKGVKQLDDYNCFVFCAGDDVKRGRKGYVDPVLYDLSEQAMLSVDGILTEEQKINLMNEFFTTEAMARSEFMKSYRAKCDELWSLRIGDVSQNANIRNILSRTIIPEPVYDAHRLEIQALQEKLEQIQDELTSCKDTDERKQLMNNRLRVQQSLREFTVSISEYRWQLYRKKGFYPVAYVNISKYEQIAVMECHYDESGFYTLDYDTEMAASYMIL